MVGVWGPTILGLRMSSGHRMVKAAIWSTCSAACPDKDHLLAAG